LPGPMIGADELRDLCLGFPGSVETFPFGPATSVFKVAGKMFALSQLAGSPLRVSLKCEPPLAEQLRTAHPAVLPGYHLNKRHWNTVIIDGSIPEQAIRDMMEDSYDLVVSRLPSSRRRALGWGTEPGVGLRQNPRRTHCAEDEQDDDKRP
jgi:predicted DNA-binding protein (MmcQ/YjbR family)